MKEEIQPTNQKKHSNIYNSENNDKFINQE